MKKANITTDMKKEFLNAQIKSDMMIRTMCFMVGYPPKETLISANDLYQAILKDVEELEEKKNETSMPREAYEMRLKESNETVCELLESNNDYQQKLDKLQRVIVAQAIQLVDVHSVNTQLNENIKKLEKRLKGEQ